MKKTNLHEPLNFSSPAIDDRLGLVGNSTRRHRYSPQCNRNQSVAPKVHDPKKALSVIGDSSVRFSSELNLGGNLDSNPSALPSASRSNLEVQIQKVKTALMIELRNSLAADDRLLRLALNEAEALAWQTAYPQLVFPTLAIEKAHAVTEWQARQKTIQQATSALSLAA